MNATHSALIGGMLPCYNTVHRAMDTKLINYIIYIAVIDQIGCKDNTSLLHLILHYTVVTVVQYYLSFVINAT